MYMTSRPGNWRSEGAWLSEECIEGTVFQLISGVFLSLNRIVVVEFKGVLAQERNIFYIAISIFLDYYS